MRFPKDLHNRLKQEAEAGERGFAAEVRRRLEASFAGPPSDPTTQRFVNAIAKIASDVSDAYGRPWREPESGEPYAAKVFCDAINELFAYTLFNGDPIPKPPKPGTRTATVLARHPDLDPGIEIGTHAVTTEGFL